VQSQRAAYGRRRELLLPALARAALRVEESEAGLYLWATRDEDCWATVADLAERGILVAPGSFYGPAGARHVRIALTATDERVAAACARL
jgi:aspartate/methionine/tyrosine aminotransferase